MSPRSEFRPLTAYYLASPVFAATDALGLGSFRIAGLEGSGVRWAYYGGAFLCGVACHRWPRSAPWVGMGESSFNLLLLLISFLVPIWSLPEVVAAGGAVEPPVSGSDLANLVVVGSVLIWSFYGYRSQVGRGS